MIVHVLSIQGWDRLKMDTVPPLPKGSRVFSTLPCVQQFYSQMIYDISSNGLQKVSSHSNILGSTVCFVPEQYIRKYSMFRPIAMY